MFRLISAFILKVLGWKITGVPPVHLKKYVLIVIPHTSNWDFPLGILVRNAAGFKVNFVAKASFYRFPIKGLFKAFGGHPIDRVKSTNFVRSIIDLYNSNEEFALTITPEGTRSKTKTLKSGFYYIAKGCNVPIVMCKFDYGNKEVGFEEGFIPTEDKEQDFEKIEAYFKGIEGKYRDLSYGIND